MTYVDTSVFGGVFDDEFRGDSLTFFHLVKKEHFKLVISSLILDEIKPATKTISNFVDKYISSSEILSVNNEALDLRSEYIKANIVSKRALSDALHVAIASVHRIPLIISWNFKDIVNFRKIAMYNAINLLNGYPSIGIYSPKEVIQIE